MNLKKLTSLLLSLVMMVTLVPMAAFAESASANTIKVSDSATANFVEHSGDVSVKVGNTIYVKLYTNDTEIKGFKTENFVYSTSSDAEITVENDTIKIATKNTTDYFDFKVSYNGTEWSFKISIDSNTSGSTGNEGEDSGSTTPQPTEVKMSYSADGGNNWNPYDYKNQESYPNGIEIDATKPTGTYQIKFIDENNNPVIVSNPIHSGESDVIGFGFTGFVTGDDGEPDWSKPTGFMANTKGINGSGYYTFKNDSLNFGCQIKFTVTGNLENPYTAATVVPVQLGASTVTVATGLTGQLSNAAEGFALSEDGTLTFTNTANAGSFDATVGSQLYTVVIFPAASTDLAEDLAIKVDTDDSAITAYLGNSSFAQNEYNFITFDNGTARDIVSSDNFMFGKNANGAYTPTYVYKTSNGALTDFDNSYIVQAVNAYMGHTSYLVKTELKKINGVDVLKVYPLTEYAGTTVKKNTMVLGQLTITKDDGSVINQNVGTTDEETELKGTNGFGADVWWMDVGAEETEKAFYIKNGQLLALYDAVDISTLKVQSTNSANVKVNEFYTAKGTENAIGFKLSITGTDKFVSELVKVSFKNKKTGADEQFYIPVICRDKEEAITTTVTPAQSAQLQEIYDNFNGTILYLQEGEYATDLYMWRGNVTIKGLGNGAVFTGSADTSKPILTFGYEGYSNINGQMSGYNNFRMFTNIAIDGKNKTKIGLKVEDGIALNLMKSAPTNGIGLDYINNCDVAIFSTNEANTSTVNVYGLTFKNNKVAIKVGHSLGYAVVGNHTKEILENNFIGNETDFEVTGENCKISIPQNFYADANGAVKANGAPTVVGTTAVDYMPYYTTADRDTVRAQLSPVATAADAETELEFLVNTMHTDKAVKLDKTLFEQIYAVKDTAAYKVSVPVIQKNEKIDVIWNFDSAKLSAAQPDATTLKVTNILSAEAQAIVDTIDTTKTTVAQAVNFSHSGNLPGETTVYVLKEGTTTIENLKLYYINTATGELELVDLNDAKVTEVTVDGTVYYAVTIDHCSEYIISTVIATEETGGETGGEGDDTTGGSTGGSSSVPADPSNPATTPEPTTAPSTNPATTPSTSTTTKTETTANDFVSAQEVEKKLEVSADKEVVVDVTDKELVSAKAFEVLAEYPEATLTFEGEDYKWTFAAADITDEDAIDGSIFNTKISLESPNAAAIKAAAGDAEIIHIYFSHHGKLPGKALVEIFAGEAEAGKTKYVHYFDGTANEFEYITEVVVQDNGWVIFEIEHCSDYVLSDKLLDTAETTEQETEPTQQEQQTEEQTQPIEQENNGSTLPIALIAIVVIIIACAVFFIKKKKSE